MPSPMNLLVVVGSILISALVPPSPAFSKPVRPGWVGVFDTLFEKNLPPEKQHPFVGRMISQFNTALYLRCVAVLISRNLVMTDNRCEEPPSPGYKLDTLQVLFETDPLTVVELGPYIEKNDKFGYAIYPISKFNEGNSLPSSLIPARLIKADLLKVGYITTYDTWAQPTVCKWIKRKTSDFLYKQNQDHSPEYLYKPICKKGPFST